MTSESHNLTARGWLVHLALDDECGAYVFSSWSMVQARRAVVQTFLRPIAYFGDDPHLELTVRGNAARSPFSR